MFSQFSPGLLSRVHHPMHSNGLNSDGGYLRVHCKSQNGMLLSAGGLAETGHDNGRNEHRGTGAIGTDNHLPE